MSLDMTIEYKNPARPDCDHPFTNHEVMVGYWWPIARQLNLPLLERLETLVVTELDDARELRRELAVVHAYLVDPAPSQLKERADYMRERIGQVMPLLEQAIDEWDQVKELWL